MPGVFVERGARLPSSTTSPSSSWRKCCSVSCSAGLLVSAAGTRGGYQLARAAVRSRSPTYPGHRRPPQRDGLRVPMQRRVASMPRATCVTRSGASASRIIDALAGCTRAEMATEPAGPLPARGQLGVPGGDPASPPSPFGVNRRETPHLHGLPGDARPGPRGVRRRCCPTSSSVSATGEPTTISSVGGRSGRSTRAAAGGPSSSGGARRRSSSRAVPPSRTPGHQGRPRTCTATKGTTSSRQRTSTRRSSIRASASRSRAARSRTFPSGATDWLSLRRRLGGRHGPDDS